MNVAGIRFHRRELRDLAAAWIALSVAFAIFLNPGLLRAAIRSGPVSPAAILAALVVSAVTVGIGFLLHELGHKLAAVHFGQVAVFRANYGMLAIAILAAMAGWLFAAPGAVHHRGRLTARQNGLIALAGPAVNLALGVTFLAVASLPVGTLADVAWLGVVVNWLLAAFNILPIGPLDGRTVLGWNPLVYLGAAAVSIGPVVVVLFDLAL